MSIKDKIYTPVSSNDIERYINGLVFSDTNFKVQRMKDFAQMRMDEVFRGNRTFEILFVENPSSTIGHFVCVIHKGPRKMDEDGNLQEHLELFDPAGTDLSTMHLYDYLNEDLATFSDNNNVTIAYNGTGMQAKDSMTCARACILRCILSHLTMDDFVRVTTNSNFKDYDEFFATMIQF